MSSRKSTRLMLLEDVDSLGRSGDIVFVKPGYARNFLMPGRKALVADRNAIRIQADLQQKRVLQAIEDKKEALELSVRLEGKVFEIERKVDEEGHMYGSVSTNDLAHLLQADGFGIEKKHFALQSPIKATGSHQIRVKLKEEVTCIFVLKINPEGGEDALTKVVDKKKSKRKARQEELFTEDASESE